MDLSESKFLRIKFRWLNKRPCSYCLIHVLTFCRKRLLFSCSFIITFLFEIGKCTKMTYFLRIYYAFYALKERTKNAKSSAFLCCCWLLMHIEFILMGVVLPFTKMSQFMKTILESRKIFWFLAKICFGIEIQITSSFGKDRDPFCQTVFFRLFFLTFPSFKNPSF